MMKTETLLRQTLKPIVIGGERKNRIKEKIMTKEKEKNEFGRINAYLATKREIDLLAANEQRPVAILIADMVEIYKAVKVGKLPAPKNAKPVRIVEVIAAH